MTHRLFPSCAARTVRVAGHFGEFLQGRMGAGGPVALVTVPCPALGVEVRHSRAPGFTLWQPQRPVLSPGRAAGFLRDLGLPRRGRFVLHADMPPGGGAGASTAALVALACAAGASSRDQIIRACLRSEGASDPLMFGRPDRILWASREGRVLSELPALPPMTILGGFWGPPRPTDPRDQSFPDIGDLVAAWPGACGDLGAMARLATASAQRCLELRGPAQDPTVALAARLGAAGWLIAHTGSARGLIFARGAVPDAAAEPLRAAGFTAITRFDCGGFDA